MRQPEASSAARPAVPTRIPALISTRFGAVVRYLEGLLGADAYRKYLAHHEESGHSGIPLTEREFWRDRTDRQDASPQGRCC